MGVGVERFQHHLLGNKQEELQCGADLGEGARWWKRLIKAIPNGHRCSPNLPAPRGDPQPLQGPWGIHTSLTKGGCLEAEQWTEEPGPSDDQSANIDSYLQLGFSLF